MMQFRVLNGECQGRENRRAWATGCAGQLEQAFLLRFQVKAGVELGQPIEAISCVANRSGLKQVATKNHNYVRK